MNALQSARYTQLIEPLLALIYSWKSFFSAGHDALKSDSVTAFLTQTQAKMQR